MIALPGHDRKLVRVCAVTQHGLGLAERSITGLGRRGAVLRSALVHAKLTPGQFGAGGRVESHRPRSILQLAISPPYRGPDGAADAAIDVGGALAPISCCAAIRIFLAALAPVNPHSWRRFAPTGHNIRVAVRRTLAGSQFSSLAWIAQRLDVRRKGVDEQAFTDRSLTVRLQSPDVNAFAGLFLSRPAAKMGWRSYSIFAFVLHAAPLSPQSVEKLACKAQVVQAQALQLHPAKRTAVDLHMLSPAIRHGRGDGTDGRCQPPRRQSP
ncbi:uncharacterized protein BDZ99DRAFT_477020 [Mytilinidion resinicola]|uniref:Uncharacterized protein n=1 Tax=Mytilinidion resinicola TaxID=574789 RepID=A0A6A6YM67_9PEZI|nr:uncharacterized protein BDZ99DRAFT_477020 [Mytilinidion resinicola]KAF2809628.1 hypothetical protein BDZ99DRAFT_477020 [Mytilinidion resinicola]